MNITDAPKLSFYNRHKLQRAGKSGCYFCIRLVDFKEIVNFDDNGNTGICPHCSSKALLPGVTEHQMLIRAGERYFTGQFDQKDIEREVKTA